MQIDRVKMGLSVAAFLAAWHLVWAALVATGLGQPVVDFVLWMHMVHLPYVVGPFEVRAAIVLIAVTGALGFVIGWFIAFLWNGFHSA